MDKITQADRHRAEQFNCDLRCGMTGTQVHNLAGAFAEHRILATRTDATHVAVEMVAELQLSAFLAGRGSIRTKANGNTHESSPGPTMDDYRRMARFALAEGWVDATPVADSDETFLTAYVSANTNIIGIDHPTEAPWQQVYDAHVALRDRLNERLEQEDLCPYKPEAGTNTHPPATDVAALVEAAKETNAALERDGDPAFAHLILDNKAALAPFTKGQNDDA